MICNRYLATIATIAVVAATPALAGPGGGGMGGGIGASVRAGTTTTNNIGLSVRDTARVQSQAAAHANARAMDKANANSAVSNDLSSETMTGSRIRTRDLMGTDSSTSISAKGKSATRMSQSGNLRTQLSAQITPGTSIADSSGATIGTVTGIRTTGNGAVKSVQVTLSSGQMITLAANSLTETGGVLTTSTLNSNVNSQGAAHANINGLIHASPNSALASAGVTTLTGLTTGLTVNDTGGTALGTVSSVLVNRSGAVVGVNVNLDAGGTVMIPATTLTMNGTTVVTTFTP